MPGEGNHETNAIDLSHAAQDDDVNFEDRAEQIDLNVRRRQQQIRLDILEDIQQRRQKEFQVNIRLRRQFAYTMVFLVGLSNLMTLGILLFAGFKIGGFELSDTVIVSAISATVAELASIFLIIVKYLFHTDSSIYDSAGTE